MQIGYVALLSGMNFLGDAGGWRRLGPGCHRLCIGHAGRMSAAGRQALLAAAASPSFVTGGTRLMRDGDLAGGDDGSCAAVWTRVVELVRHFGVRWLSRAESDCAAKDRLGSGDA